MSVIFALRGARTKRRLKHCTKWILYILLLCIIVFPGVLLYVMFNKSSTIFKITEINVQKDELIMDIRNVREQLSNEGTSKQKHILETDAEDEVQLPPFVDSFDPNGPGEGGVGVNVDLTNLTSAEKISHKAGILYHHFNLVVSDKISLHRSLPDCRSDICKQLTKKFNGTLPELSVVVVFHNEAWTTLLRSVNSILSRTPVHVLKEIILLDDNSTFDYLRAPLNKYFRSFPKVKIVRSLTRLGLIKARVMGFEASVAPVVAFLDSHIECFPGWAESMLIRIVANQKAVVFPNIPSILTETFRLKCFEKISYYGDFTWKDLTFDWTLIPQRELDRAKVDTDPYRSPVMPGGLFVIHREFFKELGMFDPGLSIWGGENVELSFKVWMCGGTLELDRCSHVGHLFRHASPYSLINGSLCRNSVRVAEVWMDDYKNYFYEMHNFKVDDPGNLTDRINLRQRLQCKNFEWYLKNVYPEKMVPHSLVYAGEVRSFAFTKCMDSNKGLLNKPKLYYCNGNGGNQVWYFKSTAQIVHRNWVLCVSKNEPVLQKTECDPPGPQWQYKQDNTLYHIPSDQCLTADRVKNKIHITPCINSTWQKWMFQKRRTDLNFPSYS